MRRDQTNETASGAVYERLLNRIKTGTRPEHVEPVSFAPKKPVEDEADVREQFGKRRGFEL